MYTFTKKEKRNWRKGTLSLPLYSVSQVKKCTVTCQSLKDGNQTISPKEPPCGDSNTCLLPGPLLFFLFLAVWPPFDGFCFNHHNVICFCHLRIPVSAEEDTDSLWLCHEVQGPVWCQRKMAASMRLRYKRTTQGQPCCAAQIAGENGKSPNSLCLKHRDSTCSPEEDMD